MMDQELIDSYQNKLSQFRLKELKDVLTQVGLSKQGRKQDLMDRIMALLYDEGTPGVFKNNVNGKEKLVEAIDDIHRMMQGSGVNGSSSKKQNGSGTSRIRKEEAEELSELERKIQCPCGSDVPIGSPLVQCVDPDCSVWQHVDCVIIPENPTEKIAVPTEFLCEICRVKRADPFWATMAHPLYPVKLRSTTLCADGTNPQLTVEKTFRLTKADRELVQKTDCDVQAWCMLLNDVVPFRMQWPLHSALEVNGIPVRTVSRAASQHLGANGRDDGAKITLYIVEGVNKISLLGTDSRSFCFGVRIVRRRTYNQVLNMIPKESDGETFEDALGRVQRCIGGGITTGNDDDSDSDLEVIADSISVNLRCPMSGSRMKTAGRFKACGHMGCFDLETFVGLNERSRKWQCPICLKNYCLEDVIVDPFFNLILNKMQSCGEEIYEIDMKPDGSWRVKNARDVGDLAQWHHPDGSIQAPPQLQTTQEHVLEGRTSQLGIQRNGIDCHANGQLYDQVENFEQNIITMSSTTSGDVNDDGEVSINQDDVEQFGVADMNEPEISSIPPHFGQTYESDNQNPNRTSADVINISDSEDDDASLACTTTIAVPYSHERCSVSAPEQKLNSYPAPASAEDPAVFSGNVDDFLVSQSPTPMNLPGGSGFEYLYDPHDSSFEHQFPSANGNAPLEVLLPSPLISGNELTNLNDSPGEDWITLKTGPYANENSSSNVAAHHESAYGNGMDSQSQFRSNEGLLQRDHGEYGLASGSGSGYDLAANGKRSYCPFTVPRQQRSVRRRSSLQSSKDITSKQS